MGRNVVQIVEGAVDKTTRQIVARNGWYERVRAGRQHQLVPVSLMATGGTHYVCITIDSNDLGEAQLNAVIGKELPATSESESALRPPKYSDRCTRS